MKRRGQFGVGDNGVCGKLLARAKINRRPRKQLLATLFSENNLGELPASWSASFNLMRNYSRAQKSNYFSSTR
jgi:hypothetical protein